MTTILMTMMNHNGTDADDDNDEKRMTNALKGYDDEYQQMMKTVEPSQRQ